MSTRNIYKITNLVNGKIYIGKTTKTIEQRFKEHIHGAKLWKNEELLGKKHRRQSRFMPALNKYGYDNFKIELVESYADDVNLEEKEKYWISYFNSTDPEIGYNISPGGLGGPLFKGHKQSEYCKQINSKRSKGISQDPEFVKKRSYARARLMQDLETGEIVSILDLPHGYFYKQTFINYRIYKTDKKFYACLEQPHNRKAELDELSRLDLLNKLADLFKDNHNIVISALHAGRKNMTKEACNVANKKLSGTKQAQRKENFNKFIQENNIDIEQYKKDYLKYKNECPNKHLELIYKIPYSKVRALNDYLGLFGGGSGHPGGKVSIKESN